ncbi:MAG TPA: NAD-dependent epimerase/dehydratase family protein [Candidatus Solibacter sp.]|nr:NAD-dependent epimerase/dehydratase family protein [Candidatus Solibacter sp.]
MKALVTGAAGFIGSNLVDRLLAAGHEVTGFDNFSTGLRQFIEPASRSPRFRMVEGDLLDGAALTRAMAGADFVFHLAANADVRFGPDHPRRDLEQNTIATSHVLEAMRASDVRRIAFSSTGSVYGEPEVFPTPETAPFPVQTSLYGASKLAAEGLIAAYAAAYGFQAWIFRFVSILGERYTHGHVFDFYVQLLAHPGSLNVLGNGRQRKSYLYVQDCIDAILLAVEQCTAPVTILNLGTDEYCEVNDSIGWIAGHLGVSPQLSYAGGERGWVGDSPFIFLDCTRMRALGWRPELTIRQGIIRTLEFLRRNQWVLEPRKMETCKMDTQMDTRQ